MQDSNKQGQWQIILFFPKNVLIFVAQDHDPMNNAATSRHEYQSPALRIIPILTENALCDSTLPGGNEDVGYEDWD